MKTGIIISVVIVLVIVAAFIFRNSNTLESIAMVKGSDEKSQSDKKNKDKEDESTPDNSGDVEIVKSWDMPDDLKELSALCYIDEQRFGTVQDELGVIFIYNIADGKIEKKVPFGKNGDYEGLAIAGKNAYVLRSDGTIFEVKDYNSPGAKTVEHKTHLGSKQDTEGFCYDKKSDRLLVSVKGDDPSGKSSKGIYAFNLSDKSLSKEPVYKIDLTNSVFDDYRSKKIENAFQPSGMSVHPQTGDIYLTEGTKPKLLILDPKGNIKLFKKLDADDFSQPEGIAINPAGTIFISNEGSKKPGNILQINNI